MGTGVPMSGACSVDQPLDVVALIGLHVEEDDVGTLLSLVHPQVTQQVVLHQQQGGEQEGAEAQGEDDHLRLVRRPVEVGEALAVEVGEPRGEEASQATHQKARGEPQGEDRHPDPRRETQPGDESPAWRTARPTTLVPRARTAAMRAGSRRDPSPS